MPETQMKMGLYRVTVRDENYGVVVESEQLPDTWVELMDNGRGPTSPADPELFFNAPHSHEVRQSDCIHVGLFSSSAGPQLALYCGRCNTWIPNANL